MAPSCIDWEPGATAPVDSPPRIVHLTKVPPSNSGIARCAVPFDMALDGLGSRTTVGLPIAGHESQRLTTVLGVLGRFWKQLALSEPDLVVVDLSGRALAEFYCAVALAARRRRPVMWLVIHDAPDIVGAPLLFSFLDRKGGRRLGMALSRTLGRALERWVVRRSGAVIAFSVLGARALEAKFGGLRVWPVPHPAEPRAPEEKERVVYCPAGLQAKDLEPTLRAFASGRLPRDFKLRVGSLSDGDRQEIEAFVAAKEMSYRVEFTGFVDQEGLDRSFATAAVVVRYRDQGHAANWAAASGPLVSAFASGCAVVGTGSRGSRRCLDNVGLDLENSPESLPEEVALLSGDPGRIERLGAAALQHIHRYHAPAMVTNYLRAIWSHTGGDTRTSDAE